MTDARHCDTCGKIASEPYVGWFRLYRESIVTYNYEHPGPFDFCSLPCLEEFARDRQRVNQG